MVRYLLLSIVLTFPFINTFAQNVDSHTALQVAENFIKSNNISNDNSSYSTVSEIDIKYNNRVVYYIINLQPKGFVIVSSYNAAPPVLGYSLENNYSTTDQPVNFSEWMNGYAILIDDLISKNTTASSSVHQQWEVLLHNAQTTKSASSITVGPLLPCLWNQGSPYNYLCPPDAQGSGGHVYAGCVATAMAQVMYYWRYPSQGTGSHGYTWNSYGYLYADFGSTTYKWEEMTNATSAQNFEMAQLQLHLGISVDMMYSGSGSGAYSQDAANSLKSYFGYDESLELVYREDYSYDDWKNLLHAQLDASQPMYYHGYGSGGHAFNIDGYQDTMYFHFNWGWGGSYNGYFHLFNLNPGGNTFTDGQGAIINFIPGEVTPNQCSETKLLHFLAGTIEDGSGPVLPYQNDAACSWLIEPQDTLENIKLTFDRFDLESGKDFIYVYDGNGNDSPLIGSYTGNAPPATITAYSGAMFIQFISDGSGASNGFLASFSAKQASFCNSNVTLLTSQEGQLTDGSGSYNYRDKTICRYKILPENAKSIILTFNEFNTADAGDYLEIYDLESQELLHKISGTQNPGTFYFNTGKLYIVFVSDQQNNASGWDFSYVSSEFTGIEKNIQNEGFTFYPNPAKDEIILLVKNQNSPLTVELINSEGIIVMKKSFSGGSGSENVVLNVAEIPRGIYALQIRSDAGSMIKKVVLTN